MAAPVSSLRKQTVLVAQKVIERRPIYLDTETTGLDKNAEIVEIAIIDDHGDTLYHSLVKPSQPIPADATRVHHITNEMVQGSPNWFTLWPEVRGILQGRIIVIYNAEYDIRLMQQSYTRYTGQPYKDRFNAFDLLKLYSEFRGEWNPMRRAYKFHSLDDAGKQCSIKLPNAHRALADTLLTRAVLHHIANTAL